MKRRSFLKGALGGVGLLIATPFLKANSEPTPKPIITAVQKHKVSKYRNLGFFPEHDDYIDAQRYFSERMAKSMAKTIDDEIMRELK